MESIQDIIDDSFLVNIERNGIIYADVNQDGFIIGHSSTLLEGGVELKIEELPEDFMTHFSFYRVNEELEVVCDRANVDKMIAEQEELNSLPTKEELFDMAIKELQEQKKELKRESIEVHLALAEMYELLLGE